MWSVSRNGPQLVFHAVLPAGARGTTSDTATLGGLVARGKLRQTGMHWWRHVQVRAAEDSVQLAMGVDPHPAGERAAAPQTAPG